MKLLLIEFISILQDDASAIIGKDWYFLKMKSSSSTLTRI